MQTTSHRINITASDRLGLTLFLALAFHALVILGISFSSNEVRHEDIISTLDITLVQHESDKKPDKADYLAQANQKGGGTTTEQVRHQAPQSMPSPEQTHGEAEVNQAPSKTKPVPPKHVQVMTREHAQKKIRTVEKQPEAKRVTHIDTQELIRRSKEIARLSAQNDAQWEAYSKRPDSKYLYANTEKHVDAAYLADWSRKVERIGNLNYPSEARLKNLTGSLIMEVTLNEDGSLVGIRILKSAPYKMLDEAAINIVKLAAPFARVPPEVLENRKVLRIVRTWSFTTGNTLSSR
jgi:protein TonB